jgi:hypothetical protein
MNTLSLPFRGILVIALFVYFVARECCREARGRLRYGKYWETHAGPGHPDDY